MVGRRALFAGRNAVLVTCIGWAVALTFAGAALRPSWAQATDSMRHDRTRFMLRAERDDERWTTPTPGRQVAQRAEQLDGHTPWYAPIASLIAPGTGQAILGENRAVAYIAVELYAYLEYQAQRTEGRRGRLRYQELARDVARALAPGDRSTGPFEYYESMEKYVESGAFDRVPGGALDPEVDETTFNGSIWRLARTTYWSNPDVPPPEESEAFAQAMSLYQRRAVLPEFQWSWRNAALEHDLFRRTVQQSNTAFRRARAQLGILVANHLLSMADAFATVRIRYPSDAPGSGLELEVRVPLPDGRGPARR